MNTRLMGLIGAVAMMVPASAMAMPVAGMASDLAPQTATHADGATLDRVVVIVRRGRPFVRRGFVGRPVVRPFRRGYGYGRPGIGVRVGPRGVGVRL